MNFHVITLFPSAFDSYIGESIIRRAIESKKIKVKFYNLRDFVNPTKIQKGKDRPYLRIDDKPYGGGPGMVIQALPVIKAIEKILKSYKLSANPPRVGEPSRVEAGSYKLVWLSPSGKQFTNEIAQKYAKKHTDVIIICGRYEGIDARVKKVFKVEEISVGPFVLTGGELPAMVIMDSVSRQIEGVLGNFSSREEARTASSDVYTRPAVLIHKKKNYRVPKVLLSGNHKNIDSWRGKKGSKAV